MLAAACVMQVSLRNIGFYDHGHSCTMWLGPESEELLKLQVGLHAARQQFRLLAHFAEGTWRCT